MGATFYPGMPDYLTKLEALNTAVNAIAGPNYAINGGFDLSRKATSVALTNAVAYNALDMWWAYMASSAAGTVSQVASPAAGFAKAAKLQRTAASALTNALTLGQTLETLDATKMQGKTVSLSFNATAGANFSAAGGALICAIDTGTGTDQSSASQAAGTWTGQVSTTQSNAISTTPTRYSMTLSVPANATQVGYRFYFTPTGTAGADDSVTITGVRLRIGTVISDLDHRDLAQELAICQRCYRRIASNVGNNAYVGTGTCNSTTAALVPAELAAGMRATPTLAYSAIGDLSAAANGVNIALTNLTVAAPADSPLLNVTVASGFVVGQAAALFVAAGTGKFIDFTAYL